MAEAPANGCAGKRMTLRKGLIDSPSVGARAKALLNAVFLLCGLKPAPTPKRENQSISRRRLLRRLVVGTEPLAVVIGLAATLVPLTGCSGFFQCEKASCPTSTTGTGTGTPTPSTAGDYAYLANSSAGTTYLSEYSIAGGKLNSLGTLSLGYIPEALAVAPSNNFLYVATVPGVTSPGVYLYNIGSTGELTVGNGGAALVTDQVAAMAMSPDGNWLFTLNVDGQTMAEYKVNTSSGMLTLAAPLTLLGTPCTLGLALPASQSCSVAVSPNGTYVVASLGISGDVVYSYTSAQGVGNGGIPATIASGYSTANPTGDYAVALDANNYAYIAQTNSVSVYGIGSLTSITPEYRVPYAAGNAPRSIALNHSYNSVYTANEIAGTISGFGITGNGTLTQLAGSPFAGPANVSALAFDNTGNYAVAVGYDATAGVQLYSVSSAGVLTQVDKAGTGTNEDYPALLAMTH